MESACAFYRDAHGLDACGEVGDRGCVFRLPDDRLLGLGASAFAEEENALDGGTVPSVLPAGSGPASPSAHLAFAVAEDDLPRWRTRLEEHDVVEVPSTVEWDRGGHSLYFRDPDGHLLELTGPGLRDFYWGGPGAGGPDPRGRSHQAVNARSSSSTSTSTSSSSVR